MYYESYKACRCLQGAGHLTAMLILTALLSFPARAEEAESQHEHVRVGFFAMDGYHMVERRILNGNRRSFHVFLTKNGRRLQQIVEQKFHEIEAVALAGISEEDLNFFLKTFQKVQDNLSSQNSSDK